jgi:aspartate/glutamate racemase
MTMESSMSIQSTNSSPKKLTFIHTVSSLVSKFEGLVKEHLPDWKPFAMLDESLLRDTIARGSLSDLTKRRLATYVWSAVDAGADAIVVTCSTLGPAVDAIAPLCPVPLFRIDEGMAKAAIERGNRIGVLATLSTTLVPTVDLLKRQACEAGKDVTIEDVLVEGAFQLLAGGDVEAHDAQICQALEELSQKVDVVVLAQASMARAMRGRANSLPVLTSPVLGVENVKRRLEHKAGL